MDIVLGRSDPLPERRRAPLTNEPSEQLGEAPRLDGSDRPNGVGEPQVRTRLTTTLTIVAMTPTPNT
jgi:hypothetical protein